MNQRLRHALLLLASFAAAAPLIWMLLASFKKPGHATSLALLGSRQEVFGPYQPPPQGSFLRFETFRPGSSQVAVAGSFNAWSPSPMMDLGQGKFRLDVPAASGPYEYKFVVDGNQWITDPKNKPPKGKENSQILLPDTSPLGINHSGVRDRSFREAGKIVPLFYEPGAKEVLFRAEKSDPSGPSLEKRLKRQSRAPPLDSSIAGPQGKTLPTKELFVLEGSAPADLSRYSFTVRRGLAERLDALYTTGNYQEVLQDDAFPFGSFFINSLVTAFGAALLTTLFCTLGGYAFATKEFPGKLLLFQLFTASMLVPGMIFMVPQFAVVTQLGWINSYWGMIVPHLANVFGLLFMTNYIRSVPKSLFEAARIDGSSEVQIIRHVLIPLSMPAMATLFTLTFMGQWSNFLWQLIVNTPDSAYRTLPVGLALFKGQYGLKVEAMMAAATFSVLPVTILFFFTQRQLIAGLTSGSVKE